MKTNAKIIALVLLVTSIKKSNAQFSTDLFLVSPKSNIAQNATGFGFNVLSKPADLGYKKDPDHLQLRLGGGFYTSSLMKNSVTNVPLSSPQIGSATVTFKNSLYGLNAIARFSRSYSKKIIPYVDVFGGLMGISCAMDVFPSLSNAQTYSSTTQRVDNINEYSYGFSGGFMFSASSRVKFNVCLTVTYSRQCGQMVDVNSAHMESNLVILNKIDPPSKILMVQAGIIFCFNKSDFQGYDGHSSLRSRIATGHRSCNYSGGGGYHSGGHSGGHVGVHIGSLK